MALELVSLYRVSGAEVASPKPIDNIPAYSGWYEGGGFVRNNWGNGFGTQFWCVCGVGVKKKTRSRGERQIAVGERDRPLKSKEQKRLERMIWLNRLTKESDIVCISQLRMDRSTFVRLWEMELLQKPQPITEDCESNRWGSFKGCLGALDGTSIRVTPPSHQKPRYRTRKSDIATNVLGVFCPNMQFIYVLPGWEGSAHDNRVLRDAISRDDGLKIPQGCYYLVDAGYRNAPGFLAPFRGERYHLNEFHGQQPQSAEEYFNMKHSKARKVIERCFYLLKGHWKILASPSFFPTEFEQAEEDEIEGEEPLGDEVFASVMFLASTHLLVFLLLMYANVNAPSTTDKNDV
uniref:DDE Tnp4 domain-containing protein n=1 Tax=Tanacetum cinerariifolium TaxID=118510 RepID=A0A6L2JBX1_TANCI|nr:hypothetical protein [Tanacetum cinerariifolium]